VRVSARLVHIVVLLVTVIGGGTAGYVVIEGWSAFDALYMTVTTVSSVGYGEVHPLSKAGRAFTLVLIVAGLGTVLYGLSAITAFWVEGDLSHMWEKRKMERRIAGLRDHIIVCGAGETGRHIALEFARTDEPFTLIEVDPDKEMSLRKLGASIVYAIGDATDGDVLRQAGVERARGLICAMPSDKDNLFTILTARELNPSLRIVSRIMGEDSRAKLLKAGADAVVSNKSIGALRLASEMVRPRVVGVLDAMLRAHDAVSVQEIPVDGFVSGRPLSRLRLQDRAGVIVFAIRSYDGRMEFNPAPNRALAAGDVLIACADAQQLAAAQAIVKEG